MLTDKQFFEKIKPMVIADYHSSKILASLTAAQAFLESGYGNSALTVKANNLFGIKGSYNRQSVIMQTKEYVNGKCIQVPARFRQYPSWKESIEDHSRILTSLTRYKNIVGCKNYKTACRYIQLAGYATDPNYADSLIRLIQKYHLDLWDNESTENPYREPVTNVKMGDKGSIVRWVQYELVISGYDVKIDGIFGPKTDACVRKFQFKNGLLTDGIVGSKTRAKMKEV